MDIGPEPGRAGRRRYVVDDDTFLNRLILGGGWTWADRGIGTAQ